MFLFPVSSHTRGTRNLHLNDVLSTNQHILLNVNEKRGLSAHCTPSPLPQSSASLSFVPHSLSFFESLPFFLPLVSPSLSLASAVFSLSHPNMPLQWSVVIYSAAGLMSVNQWGHVWSLRVTALQGHWFFFLSFFPLFSLGHMVLPKGKSELSTRTHPQTARAFLVR